MQDLRRTLPAEHDVELRESEDEPLASVDEDDVGVRPELLGERRRDLQPAETCAQDDNSHGADPTEQVSRRDLSGTRAPPRPSRPGSTSRGP